MSNIVNSAKLAPELTRSRDESTAYQIFLARIAAQSEDAKARCPRILDSNINYLRSAQPKHTFASAEIIRQGRRTSLVQVTCWQDERNRPITSGWVQLLFATTDTDRQGDHEG